MVGGNGTMGEAVIGQHARPLRLAEVEAFSLDDELVLYDTRSGETYALNRTGARLWLACDGSWTVAALAGELAGAFGIPRSAALADVRDLLGKMEDADIIALR